VPSIALPSAAAATNSSSSSSIVGERVSWGACLQRVQLAHEGLLLLRALVATDGAIGACVPSLLVRL
jgi:hypothetical protein